MSAKDGFNYMSDVIVMLRHVWFFSLLPIKVQMLAAGFVGSSSFMEEFHGRVKRD